MKKTLLTILHFLCFVLVGQAQVMTPVDPPTINTSVDENKNTGASTNSNCKLVFNYGGLASAQSAHPEYMVYDVKDMTASELKASVLNTISSMYKSPKDVVTNLSDNMIQLEAYMPRVFYKRTGSSSYPIDFIFTWTIQFKDNKIRINVPSVKKMWATRVPIMGTLDFDMSKPLSILVDDNTDRTLLTSKLNDLVKAICENAKSANDW